MNCSCDRSPSLDHDAADRVWIVDGTLVPVRDRKVGASSRDYRFSANVQVIIDADTRLVVAISRPAPDNKADAHAGAAPACRSSARVSSCSATAPTSTPASSSHIANDPAGPCRPGEEADNKEHRRVRAQVEHAIGRLKNHKILRDCRQHGDGLHRAVQAVARMHNPALAA
ncbi:DDE superfamily endonuclease [Streptomyces sp. 3213]|nr:DDE superfamily endonuclease [Streptomyces sp. 3213] [Streptomyces sp. 3213.3]